MGEEGNRSGFDPLLTYSKANVKGIAKQKFHEVPKIEWIRTSIFLSESNKKFD